MAQVKRKFDNSSSEQSDEQIFSIQPKPANSKIPKKFNDIKVVDSLNQNQLKKRNQLPDQNNDSSQDQSEQSSDEQEDQNEEIVMQSIAPMPQWKKQEAKKIIKQQEEKKKDMNLPSESRFTLQKKKKNPEKKKQQKDDSSEEESDSDNEIDYSVAHQDRFNPARQGVVPLATKFSIRPSGIEEQKGPPVKFANLSGEQSMRSLSTNYSVPKGQSRRQLSDYEFLNEIVYHNRYWIGELIDQGRLKSEEIVILFCGHIIWERNLNIIKQPAQNKEGTYFVCPYCRIVSFKQPQNAFNSVPKGFIETTIKLCEYEDYYPECSQENQKKKWTCDKNIKDLSLSTNNKFIICKTCVFKNGEEAYKHIELSQFTEMMMSRFCKNNDFYQAKAAELYEQDLKIKQIHKACIHNKQKNLKDLGQFHQNTEEHIHKHGVELKKKIQLFEFEKIQQLDQLEERIREDREELEQKRNQLIELRNFYLNKSIKSSVKLMLRQKQKLIQCKEKLKGINHKNLIQVYTPELIHNTKYMQNHVARLNIGPKIQAEINHDIFNTVDSLEKNLNYNNLLARRKTEISL